MQCRRIKKSKSEKSPHKSPRRDLAKLTHEVENGRETFEMMRLAESAFGEWLEPDEDIYDEKS